MNRGNTRPLGLIVAELPLAVVIVGVGYLLFGGIAMFLALRDMKVRGLIPRRTIRVQKEDAA